jgi:hypothetical protein
VVGARCCNFYRSALLSTVWWILHLKACKIWFS